MRNYLVGCARPVINHWGPWKGSGENPYYAQDAQVYREMYRLSRLSARRFLQGDWQEFCFVSPILDARLNTLHIWYQVRELWHQEPCNILCMGADTLFVKHTEIFDQFAEFRLFNYTEPRQHREFRDYFNDDIRYIPHRLDPGIWLAAERQMCRWLDPTEQSQWDLGQIIHNQMFWSQRFTEWPARPELAFQVLHFDDQLDSDWNNLPLADAHILHLHGSRGAQDRVSVMRSMLTQLGIDPDAAE